MREPSSTEKLSNKIGLVLSKSVTPEPERGCSKKVFYQESTAGPKTAPKMASCSEAGTKGISWLVAEVVLLDFDRIDLASLGALSILCDLVFKVVGHAQSPWKNT